MLISYTFAYIYLCVSIGTFLKDIFLKEICKTHSLDSNVINDFKVAFPLVKTNAGIIITTLAYIDLYFFVFGSNYNIIATLIYITLGIPVMFLVNSIMGMGNMTYLHSRHTYDKECQVTTRNPMFILFCDDGVVHRFCRLLYLLTFLFGRNEYVISAFVFVPYCMALFTTLNIDLTKIDDTYDLDTLTENEYVQQIYQYFLQYENYTILGATKLKNVFFF